MEHKYEDKIICPYCDWADNDSWEFTEDNGTHTCGRCEKEFNVDREIEVTYSTSRINCEENKTEHDYQFEDVFRGKRKYSKGNWEDLPESEWTYNRIMMCSICDAKEYISITKDEYEIEVAKIKNK